MVEEAAATALELHEAALVAAQRKEGGESDVRARHRKLMEQAPQAV